jgi:hypothetical protein
MQPQSILRDPTDRPFIAETMCDVSDLLKMKERGEKEKGGNAPCVRAQVVCVCVCAHPWSSVIPSPLLMSSLHPATDRPTNSSGRKAKGNKTQQHQEEG